MLLDSVHFRKYYVLWSVRASMYARDSSSYRRPSKVHVGLVVRPTSAKKTVLRVSLVTDVLA